MEQLKEIEALVIDIVEEVETHSSPRREYRKTKKEKREEKKSPKKKRFNRKGGRKN